MSEDAIENIQLIENSVRELETLANLPDIGDAIMPFTERKCNTKAVWAKVKEINVLFKETWLPKEDRGRLWNRFGEICADVKEIQNRIQEQRESSSNSAREEIHHLIEKARNASADATNRNELDSAKLYLHNAKELLKERDMIRVHLDECWTAWKSANDYVWDQRERLFEQNRYHIEAKLNYVGGIVNSDPRGAIAEIQIIQQEMRALELSKHQREGLRNSIQHLWNHAQEKNQEEWEHKKARHEEWVERAGGKVERLTALLEKNEGMLKNLQQQINDLEEKIETSWNDDWADTARGWVSEKYDVMRDIERTNAEVSEKIQEITQKL